MKNISMPMNITSADSNSRTISGTIVTFGEAGNTSVGKTIFEQGSIQAANVKLLLEHDRTRPIGRAIEMTATDNAITAVFKIAETTAGNDALVEASQGLRDGFSVGVAADEWTVDNEGTFIVKAASLEEVSLVTEPAIRSARVSDVAASENTEDSETVEVADTPTPTEGDEVDNTVTDAAAVEETVEAAQQVTAKAAPAFSAGRLRSPIVDAASYLEHKVKAHKGDYDSFSYVRQADAELANVDKAVRAADSAGNTGLVHDSWLNEIVTTSLGTTAAIDAVGVSPLMETGLSFKIPAVTQYPTAGTTAEGAAASDTDMETGDIDVSIIKKAGKQVITFELFDRSTPSFYQEVLRQIQVALGKSKDEYLLAQLVAGGTAASTTAGTIAGLQSFIATETSAALSGSGDFADMLLTSPDWWTTIKAAKDTTGRGLYNAINPMNANGRVTPQSLRGEVEGMNLYVDPFLAAGSGLIDNSALILTGQAARYWESPIRQIQINNLTEGAVEVEYYQYVAAQVVKPAGVRKFNLT